MSKQVKLVFDTVGTADKHFPNTRVVDAETGEPVFDVMAYQLTQLSASEAEIRLIVYNPWLEGEIKAVVTEQIVLPPIFLEKMVEMVAARLERRFKYLQDLEMGLYHEQEKRKNS